MSDDEDILRQAIRDRDKAQDSATIWKCIAICLFIVLVWAVLEGHGCFGGAREGWTGPGP